MKLLMKRVTFIVLAILLFMPILSWTSIKVGAEAEKPAAASNSDIVPGKVIVKYKQAPSLHSRAFMVSSIRSLIKVEQVALGTSVTEKIAELQQDPNVEYAEPVYKVHLAGTVESSTVTKTIYDDPFNPEYMRNWGKIVTGLTFAVSVTSKQQLNNVTVAVIDTGVDLHHPDLVSSMLPGYDFVNRDADPQDDNGHGTNVAGIIAAQAHDHTGYTGVAPGVKIMPIKVLDQQGSGDTAQMLDAIQYAITNHANIINLSLGFGNDSKAIHDVIKQAVQKDILVVAAAGNDSNNWINGEPGQPEDSYNTRRTAQSYMSYPAAYDEVISVGAVEQLVDSSLTAADFSNILKVDVAAPGYNIYSTNLTAINGGYGSMNGTSQAAPFVSAYAALLKANNAVFNVSRIRDIIQNSASYPTSPDLLLNYSNVNRPVNVFDIFGHGVINGGLPFEKGALRIVPDLSQNSSGGTITLAVYAEDYKGTQRSGTSQVYLEVNSYKEENGYRNEYTTLPIGGLNQPIDIVDGVGHFTFNLPLQDSFHYEFRVAPVVHDLMSPSSVQLISRPATPVPSIDGGSYTGNQTVSLTSATPNAQIYFSLSNNYGSGYDQLYNGPITITGNSLLRTYSFKNHLYSEDAEYAYTITPVTFNGAGGGGGGGIGGPVGPIGPVAPVLPEVPQGETSDTVLALNPDHATLLDQANSAETKEIVIDAKAKDNRIIDTIILDLKGDIIQKAAEHNKPVVINADDLQLTLPPNAFEVKAGTANVQFKISSANAKASDLPAFAASASKVYDFNLFVDGNRVTSFNAAVKAALKYDAAKIQDAGKLGVYYYEQQSGNWTYMGGTLNKDTTITAILPHFSQYAVLEYKKTFDDIQNHWARKEIENLAAKQIINGLTDQTYAPEASVTRAQFVAILARALKLTNSAHDHTFKDVPEDAWYKDVVYQAYHANIVSGMDDDSFAPNANITREQMASLLVRAYLYAAGKNLSELPATQEVKYTDEGAISSWAKENIQLASALGLVNGMDGGKFSPSGQASRAQAAVVMYRLLEIINKQ